MPDAAVWLLDSSSIINLKRLIPKGDQWDAFKALEEKVHDGTIAFPRHVIREVSEIDHPDVPGVWVHAMRTHVQYGIDPDDDYVREVMNVAGDVVETNSLTDEADPYLLAMALELRRRMTVKIVTDDVVDRMPLRIAISTACGRLAIPWCTTHDFLQHFGLPSR